MHIWTDIHDRDTVIIGDRIPAMNGLPVRYVAWGSMHIDGVSDLFGSDVHDAVRTQGPNPVNVETVTLFIDDEDITGSLRIANQLSAVAESPIQTSESNTELKEVLRWMENIGAKQ